MANIFGTSGPKRKAIEFKVLEGKGKQEREVPRNRPRIPKYKGSRPNYTVWWPDEAKRYWKRMAPKLKKVGILSVTDITAMEALCLSYASFIDATKFLKENGNTYTAANGNILARPEVNIRNIAWKETLTLLCHFGATPATAAKVRADPDLLEKDGESLLD